MVDGFLALIAHATPIHHNGMPLPLVIQGQDLSKF
jgi:hypothetical protein